LRPAAVLFLRGKKDKRGARGKKNYVFGTSTIFVKVAKMGGDLYPKKNEYATRFLQAQSPRKSFFVQQNYFVLLACPPLQPASQQKAPSSMASRKQRAELEPEPGYKYSENRELNALNARPHQNK